MYGTIPSLPETRVNIQTKPPHTNHAINNGTAQKRTLEEFPKYFSHLRGFRLAKVGYTS